MELKFTMNLLQIIYIITILFLMKNMLLMSVKTIGIQVIPVIFGVDFLKRIKMKTDISICHMESKELVIKIIFHILTPLIQSFHQS